MKQGFRILNPKGSSFLRTRMKNPRTTIPRTTNPRTMNPRISNPLQKYFKTNFTIKDQGSSILGSRILNPAGKSHYYQILFSKNFASVKKMTNIRYARVQCVVYIVRVNSFVWSQGSLSTLTADSVG